METARGSIRILGRNKATMSSEEVEIEKSKVAKQRQTEEKSDTRTALRACQAIHVPPMTQFLVIVRFKLPRLVYTEHKHSVFVNHHLTNQNGVHEVDLEV